MSETTALPSDRAALEWATPDIDFKVAKIARVSAPENEQNTLTAQQLVQYLMKNAHWSPLEMVCVCIEVHTTRDIGRQMLRHSLRVQEFSQRYASVSKLEGPVIRQGRLRDPKNRQNSIPTLDPALQAQWAGRQQAQWDNAVAHYNWALENGLAKECARVVLPEGNTPTRMYFQAPLRDWLFYCNLRRGNGTQKEHMDVAEACWQVLCAEAPMATAAFSAVMEDQQNASTEIGRLRRIMEAAIAEVSRWSVAAAEELERLFRGR